MKPTTNKDKNILIPIKPNHKYNVRHKFNQGREGGGSWGDKVNRERIVDKVPIFVSYDVKTKNSIH
jgi:hypothetical protein